MHTAPQTAPSVDPRVLLAERALLERDGPFHAAGMYVRDADLTARVRREEAARLVRQQDRRDAYFVRHAAADALPCPYCGGTVRDGDAVDVIGRDVLHRDCATELGADMGYGVPEFGFLAPAEVVAA